MPERTCVACRQVRPKRELLRVVHSPADRIEVDPTGKKAGRGAYLCRMRTCWELALKRHSLEQALKTSLSPEDREALTQFATTLPSATVGQNAAREGPPAD